MYCANELTRHMATPNNSRLGKDGEIGEVFEEQMQGSVVVQIPKKRRGQLETFSDTVWAGLQKNTPQHNRRIHSCRDLISSNFGAKHKLLWHSVQRKPNCTA